MTMELASNAVAALAGLLGIVIGFRLQDRSTERRDRRARQIQQRAELRAVIVKLLSRLAAMRRLQSARSVLREDDASEAEQEVAKTAAVEARTVVGEALTELQLLTEGARVLALADRIVDVTFTLHEAADRADRDRRFDPRQGRAQRLRRSRRPARAGLTRTTAVCGGAFTLRRMAGVRLHAAPRAVGRRSGGAASAQPSPAREGSSCVPPGVLLHPSCSPA
ncbi:hypothetical protein OHT77_01015 [Streptomyces sp. NBC_00252]|uniref:hypothetical protein n=1 Tax=Streptomyces sp. NBC_00252 TaxID=2975691 RepID=UPI002E2A5346|nr:hypothetical protein [Streptomyces sp. NBC_00252]